MIIFYNKLTGDVMGTIDGRVHSEAQLKASIGQTGVPDDQVGKIVCQWQPVETTHENGEKTVAFEPIHPQQELMALLDQTPTDVYKYKVDVKSEALVLK